MILINNVDTKAKFQLVTQALKNLGFHPYNDTDYNHLCFCNAVRVDTRTLDYQQLDILSDDDRDKRIKIDLNKYLPTEEDTPW